MGNVLEKSSAWLEQMREKHLTRSVDYCHENLFVTVQATIGRTMFQIARDFGPFEKFESRDFLVSTADLVLEDSLILPQRGDQIRESAGARVYVYEVMAPGTEPHFRYSDLYRLTLRIHTKLVKTLEA